MVNFKETFRGNLTEVISANKIISFGFQIWPVDTTGEYAALFTDPHKTFDNLP